MRSDYQEQIEALETAAGTAGDLHQAAICQIALHGEPRPATMELLAPEAYQHVCLTYGDPNADDVWLDIKAMHDCLAVIREHAEA